VTRCARVTAPRPRPTSWGCQLARLCPCQAEPPLHALALPPVVKRRHERRVLGALPFAPPSGGRERRQLFLRLGETRVQPLHLALGRPRRAQHHHPFAPRCRTVFQATRPFNRIPRGCQHLCRPVRAASNPLPPAVPALLSSGVAPLRQRFRRRARSRQRRPGHVLATRHVRAGPPGPQLTIADTQEAALVQLRLGALAQRQREASISALTRAPIRGSRPPQRGQ